MKKAEFLELVQAELDHLRVHATDEEKSKLDIEVFDHTDPCECIYGLMTGDCSSKRAKELYPKSFKYVSNFFFEGYSPFSKQRFSKGNEFTPLEKYLYTIANKDGSTSIKQKEIIQYIKNEINTIQLT